ncbi:uncharacterized protein [Blastocystis hominis]|uniref:Uncharacterized protein n=1 Tax=Blastocystis hominis TaxID=12968 RepID=D8M9V3_BLAHO|nr:uncharacterized protein [Blastocystis hominis]CBK24842.2 unnamed protein product [Blastocystis hominis]|eukprot:XP_012898890.1 uncharacterized protein [Blastocystis hominis]
MSLACSPEGDLLATGHKDGSLTLLDLSKLRVLHTLHDHAMPIRTLVFSASKQLYAGCDDGSVSCHDCRTESFALVDSLQGHTGFVTAVDISADEKYLVSSSADKKVIVWSLKERETPQTMNCHNCIVWSVAFSPDGSKIVSTGDDGSVQIYVRKETV